jgi:hypothetical protein
MYSTTLFLIFSALVATQAAPDMPPADTSIAESEPTPKVVSYAGAPADGEYPDQITDMGGWEADAPTYDPSVCPSTLGIVSTGGLMIRLLLSFGLLLMYVSNPSMDLWRLIISPLVVLPQLMDLDLCPLQT